MPSSVFGLNAYVNTGNVPDKLIARSDWAPSSH